MDKFFDKFPNVYYNGVLCKDITRRVSINNGEEIQGNLDIYYPYTIEQHLRPDQVAGFYYEDPEQDWMVYLANDVIDPYHGWYLDNHQFGDFIIEKYGSIETAQRKIMFFRNNWYKDTQHLTPAYYENNLDKRWRKYYEPVWGPGTRIMSYKRKQIDDKMNTNRIIKYTVNDIDFTVGETVTFHKILTPAPGDPPTTPDDAIIGKGDVVMIEGDDTVYIQNVIDHVRSTVEYSVQLRGTISGTRATAFTDVLVFENITEEEAVFWSAVTAWDVEEEINESKKDIYLVGKGYHSIMSQQVAKELKLNVDNLTGLVKDG